MLKSPAINWGSPVNRASPLNRGLVGWWFAAPTTVTAGTFFDLLNRYAATTSNGQLLTASTANRNQLAVLHTGSTVYTTGTVAHDIGTGDFAMAAWVRPTSSSTFQSVLGVNDLKPALYSKVSTGWGGVLSGNMDSTSVLPLNEWSHILMCRRGTTIYFYQNGVELSTTFTKSNSIANAVVRLNKDASASLGTAGKADDYRIWNRTVNADDAWAIYADSCTGYQQTLNRLPRRFAYQAAAPPASTYSPIWAPRNRNKTLIRM